jgi:hypothetical protein
MATVADTAQIASHARRLFIEELLKGLPALVLQVSNGTRALLDKPADHATAQRRRDLTQGLIKHSGAWHSAMATGLRHVLQFGVSASNPQELPRPGGGGLSLVDNDTIEREILTSRLALAVMDKASWEFTDLRSRIAMLEHRGELDTHDMLRAHVLSRVALDAWFTGHLTATDWREAQPILHEEFALLAEEAYHETNRWLIGQHVMQDVDLRPFIRRRGPGATTPGQDDFGGGHDARQPAGQHSQVGEETRLMTRSAPFGRGGEHAEAVLTRLNRLVGRHLPGFADTARSVPMSDGLSDAINQAQRTLRQRLGGTGVAPASGGRAGMGAGRGVGAGASAQLLDELQQNKQALKQAATTPAERATIEIVAMMFQSILTEDRIPAALRVWFARLQMPVLRVAVSEPDFFATLDHPARRLIDRMGACVMGLDSASAVVGDALEKEIKRVVQVVEAYPDTGRRVFQTVLVEFEKFLEHYFKNENEATRRGVSLAQQVEQRETLAIQYTIELRKMLNEVPVQEGVRQFLFQVWADVLATSAVRYGAQSVETKAMKRAAADLIWSAGAKVTREERAEVIRRLPPLLKRLREGMATANIGADKQDERINALNNALAAAFTAKAAVISNERLQDLMGRLDSLEELLPGVEHLEIDESVVLDLSGHESSELEVVSEGGTMPTAPMLAWARELLIGSWYMLEYRNRVEPVQLSWHGLRRQLALFVTPNGRCVLFQHQRLAAFLQAGLLRPAQEETLTVRATRTALAKLDADPSRLMN